MSRSTDTTSDRWSRLGRQELVALGRSIVTERLERLGCSVTAPYPRTPGRLSVETPSGRALEMFVSTQRVGGYTFWTKRRFEPARHRFAAIVLLADHEDPDVYLVPSTAWRDASPPLTDRPNVGKRSEAEYGISLARSNLASLQRYSWNEVSASDEFR
jgi:hypothetical protein